MGCKIIRLMLRIFLLAMLVGCVSNKEMHISPMIRHDVRFANDFYSICVFEDSSAYVIKGTGSNYMEPLVVTKADTSDRFKLDSFHIYMLNLERLVADSIFHNAVPSGPRAEIFLNGQKVYDSYFWRKNFWDVVRPIIPHLPPGFSPFRLEESPFGIKVKEW